MELKLGGIMEIFTEKMGLLLNVLMEINIGI
jgi:hypothetical protein